MKLLIIMISFIFSFNALGDTNKMSLKQIVENDKWTVAEGYLGEDKMFLRYRHEIKHSTDVSKYPKAIHVFWKYEPNDSGMPSAEVNKDMGVFEEHLVNALEVDMSGVITAIITKEGSRHWLFYSKDTNTFASKLQSIPHKNSAYPIEIEANNDNEWKDYFENMYIPPRT
ncbi:DUF695 domain-containing protein [uncultured Psychrosphaera sp.]|jgi:hypothetical protein|uniref:DUF695 domain-containing protein n=1 Tax=uncultured Psychrosphaera sp. TaxID=1403522 RepID=UPI002638B45A|nr:DUF695 domain-containing protein [uncultured Psychrosphaera sp.]